jgi:hypothetical protein
MRKGFSRIDACWASVVGGQAPAPHKRVINLFVSSIPPSWIQHHRPASAQRKHCRANRCGAMTAALYQTPQSAELQVPRPGPRWGARLSSSKRSPGGMRATSWPTRVWLRTIRGSHHERQSVRFEAHAETNDMIVQLVRRRRK